MSSLWFLGEKLEILHGQQTEEATLADRLSGLHSVTLLAQCEQAGYMPEPWIVFQVVMMAETALSGSGT